MSTCMASRGKGLWSTVRISPVIILSERGSNQCWKTDFNGDNIGEDPPSQPKNRIDTIRGIVRPQDLMINSGEQNAVPPSSNVRDECSDRGAGSSSSEVSLPPTQHTGALSINKLVASGHQPITPLATPPPSPESGQDAKSCEAANLDPMQHRRGTAIGMNSAQCCRDTIVS